MEYKTLQCEITGSRILKLTLSRPQARNAINSVMMAELLAAWQSLSHDSAVRCVVLTGAGSAFCAGADLKERDGLDLATWRQHHTLLERAMLAMIDCPVPVIAAVNGPAFGGGLELVLACDFAYASTAASFAMPETRLGIMPGAMGTQTLPRAAGSRRAKEICFTGGVFSAAEALNWGVVNKLCPPESLLDDVFEVAARVASNAPLAVRQAKIAMSSAEGSDLKSGYQLELEAYNKLIPTADREEGIQAFNQKRKPQFQGR